MLIREFSTGELSPMQITVMTRIMFVILREVAITYCVKPTVET